MTAPLNDIIHLLVRGEDISRRSYELAFEDIMAGKALDAELGALLTLLLVRREEEALEPLVTILRRVMISFKADEKAIDNCGTGGDGKGGFNISTSAALVAAAMGVKLAKHGNRAVSSRSGSADVLEAAGAKLDAPKEKLEELHQKIGFAFLFAPLYHPMMKHVMPVRRSLAMRTIFNCAGPLANPAGCSFALMGVFADEWRIPMAHCFKNLGGKGGMFVHGDGYDEIVSHAPTHVTELKEDGSLHEWILDPQEFGITQKEDVMKGGDAAHNASLMKELLAGEPSSLREVVALNAAAMAYIVGKQPSLKNAYEEALEVTRGGRALSILEQYCVKSHD